MNDERSSAAMSNDHVHPHHPLDHQSHDHEQHGHPHDRAMFDGTVFDRLAFDRRTALIATFFVAINPFLIYYSQEARMYEMLAALTPSSAAILRVLQCVAAAGVLCVVSSTSRATSTVAGGAPRGRSRSMPASLDSA